MPMMLDEPMDMEDSPPPPPPHEDDVLLPVKHPLLHRFDEANYARFYKPQLCAFRKQLAFDSVNTDLRKQHDRIFKLTKQLAESEVTIESVKSLRLTAQTRSLLVTQKINFLAENIGFSF